MWQQRPEPTYNTLLYSCSLMTSLTLVFYHLKLTENRGREEKDCLTADKPQRLLLNTVWQTRTNWYTSINRPLSCRISEEKNNNFFFCSWIILSSFSFFLFNACCLVTVWYGHCAFLDKVNWRHMSHAMGIFTAVCTFMQITCPSMMSCPSSHRITWL